MGTQRDRRRVWESTPGVRNASGATRRARHSASRFRFSRLGLVTLVAAVLGLSMIGSYSALSTASALPAATGTLANWIAPSAGTSRAAGPGARVPVEQDAVAGQVGAAASARRVALDAQAAEIAQASTAAQQAAQLEAERVATLSSYQSHLTGYTYWDNDPPGSAAIAYPRIHKRAGGTGTYADPITAAIGRGSPFTAGTRFYIPYLRRYVIIEDLCGACRGTGLDIWIDGSAGSFRATNLCTYAITGTHAIIKDPAPDYAVVPGPIFGPSGCSAKYGDTPVKA